MPLGYPSTDSARVHVHGYGMLQLLLAVAVLRIIQYIWAVDVDFRTTDRFPLGVSRLARLASVETDMWSVIVFLAWAKLRAYLSRFKALSRLVIMIESVGAQAHYFFSSVDSAAALTVVLASDVA